MKTTIFLTAALAANAMQAQEPYRALFCTDPETSNGTFIVNAEKAASLNMDRVEIKIIVAELLPNGVVDHTVVESLTIADSFYAQADLGLLQGFTHGEVVYYTFTGYDAMGTVVINGTDRTNGEPVWPAICEETCDSRWYAWTLTAYSDNVERTPSISSAVHAMGKHCVFTSGQGSIRTRT